MAIKEGDLVVACSESGREITGIVTKAGLTYTVIESVIGSDRIPFEMYGVPDTHITLLESK